MQDAIVSIRHLVLFTELSYLCKDLWLKKFDDLYSIQRAIEVPTSANFWCQLFNQKYINQPIFVSEFVLFLYNQINNLQMRIFLRREHVWKYHKRNQQLWSHTWHPCLQWSCLHDIHLIIGVKTKSQQDVEDYEQAPDTVSNIRQVSGRS